MLIYVHPKIRTYSGEILVKKILTKFAVAKKAAEGRGAIYRSPRIYLPTKLTDDSSFPFKEGDLISVRVDGRKLLVQRVRKAFEADDEERSHNTSSRTLRSGS
jgi:hypothetical protein